MDESQFVQTTDDDYHHRFRSITPRRRSKNKENWVEIHDRWRADRLIALWRAVFNEAKKKEEKNNIQFNHSANNHPNGRFSL